MKRSPLARGSSTLSRTTRLSPVSAKRAAERPLRDAVRAETIARAGGRCQLAALLPEIRCWHPDGPGALDVDELASRGVAPGSHLDARVTIAVCRAHHDWRTAHPAEARALGIRITGAEYDTIRDSDLNRTTDFQFFGQDRP